MDKMTQLFYDKVGDVLYLSVGEPRSAISREIGDDVLLRVDLDTEEVGGVTILNLSSRFSSLDNPQSLPLTIQVTSHES